MWFMTSLIIATVYRSNLKAMLIMPRIQLPFDNLEELHQSQYPLYTVKTSATHRAIVVSQDFFPVIIKSVLYQSARQMVICIATPPL